MSPKSALTIGAVMAALFGILLVFAPGPMLKGFGLLAPDEGIILSRDLGVTLLSIALLNWLARDATGTALRAVLIGNLAIQAMEIAVNGYEISVGMLPSKAAGGLVIHAVMGVIFLLALRRASTKAPA
ncbi:MAG: hypothetical protein HW397_546 [Dehalococcoidia bacterium]|nr:hypothetical protein [Dehalococcoidia bacterium]